MRRKKKSDNNEEISYWESMADLMSALILMILLVFVLVLLYIVRIPEIEYKDWYDAEWHGYIDRDDGGHFGGVYDENDHDDYDPEKESEEAESQETQPPILAVGGGTDDGQFDEEPIPDYEFEFPGMADGVGKTAVHVTAVDAESGKIIRKSGATFELFRDSEAELQLFLSGVLDPSEHSNPVKDDAMQVLCTYYPKKIEYRKFETTDEGIFFLPEKIISGVYYFRNVVAPEGYDQAPNTTFEVLTANDWPEPLEVKIPFSPAKNTIRIKMTDEKTGLPVKGAVYEITAEKDIVTFDGTLRYKEGEIVDTISCNEDGYAETTELFLGDYEVREITAPEFYIRDRDVMDVTLYQKGTPKDKTIAVAASKTTVNFEVYDELETSLPIEGAVFQISDLERPSTMRSFTTDTYGSFTAEDFRKNSTYAILQISSKEGYRFDESSYVIHVDKDGYLEITDGNATITDAASGDSTSGDSFSGSASDSFAMTFTIYNRILRASFSVKDTLIRNHVTDYSAALYDSKNTLLSLWDTIGIPHEIDGLEPGLYRLVLQGDTNHPYEMTIKDTSSVQAFVVSVWTINSILFLLVVIIVFVVLTLTLLYVIRRKKPKQDNNLTL